MKSLIIVHSYHHQNTLKVAKAMAEVLNAEVRTTTQPPSHTLSDYDLVGFGAGIDSGKHYRELLDYAQALPQDVHGQKCFIFSTSAIQGKSKVAGDHATLRRILTEKGFVVLGEFSCKGFNTNSFLKHIGGMNKRHPDAKDIENAKRFAAGLIQDA